MDDSRWPGAPSDTGGPIVRFADAHDISETIRLAGLMYQAMGLDPSARDWQIAAREALQLRLGDDVAVFVVDAPAMPGRLAACGAASIATRLPGPSNPSARFGYLQWVSTDSEWRRQGMARAVTVALLQWLRERGVRSVELHATSTGEPLYRSLGFVEGQNRPLRLRI